MRYGGVCDEALVYKSPSPAPFISLCDPEGSESSGRMCVFGLEYVYTPSKLIIGHGSRDSGAKSRKQDTVPTQKLPLSS